MAGPINLKLLTNFFNKIGPEPPRLRLMAGGFRGYFGRDRDEAARPTPTQSVTLLKDFDASLARARADIGGPFASAPDAGSCRSNA